jgi:hypothetical protein
LNVFLGVLCASEHASGRRGALEEGYRRGWPFPKSNTQYPQHASFLLEVRDEPAYVSIELMYDSVYY